MATIDASYFFGDLLIAQKSETSVASNLNLFIDEHEPRLLADLMGYDLYEAYKAGIAAGSPLAKWTELRSGVAYTTRSGISTKWPGLIFTNGTAKKSLIANYVYWLWMENTASDSTGTGEKITAAQNAANASPASKMIRAWNQMVNWNCELIEFLLTKADTYPEFQSHYSRIPCSLLKKQNLFGI